MKSLLKKLFLITFLLTCCTFIYHFSASYRNSEIMDLSKYFGNKMVKSTTVQSIYHSTTQKKPPTPTTTPPTTTTSKPVSTKKPKPTPRPNVCKGCFQNTFDILLENKDICKVEPGKKLDLVIIIFTYKKSVRRREAIRKTWTQHTKNNTANIRYLFAFGKYPTQKVNKDLVKEATMYGDIVQAAFGESYYNLTYKTITMLGWVIKNCPNTKNIMKTDDDMWINVPKIVEKFNRDPIRKGVAGCCILNARPIRSKDSKWYASPEIYPRNDYPDFCSGTGYVLDINTAINIHKTSVDVPFLYLEDVYVALCLEHLGYGYRVRPTYGFNNGKYSMSNLCDFKRFVLTSHYMSPKDIEQIWDAKC